MKKYLVLGVILGVSALALSACDFKKVNSNSSIPIPLSPIQQTVNSETGNLAGGECTFIATSSLVTKVMIPPKTAPNNDNKIFTYEDRELGVSLKYPGSCYYNLGVFQCSNFEMSIWELDNTPANNHFKNKERLSSFSNGQTEIQHIFISNGKIDDLKAWYDGTKNTAIEKQIDAIADTFVFTKK
jgi:hypothetical protein